MNKIYLLDTSVVIELFRNNPSIVARLSGISIMLCSPVIGELYFGALKSAAADFRADSSPEELDEIFRAINQKRI